MPASRSLPEEWLRRHEAYLVSEVRLQKDLRRRRRRRVALALVPAAVVVLAATAFTTYALTREPTHLESIGCYDAASLTANITIVEADGRSPIAICAELWQQGGMRGATTPKQLAACVLQTGAVGVFPRSGADTCAQLGLADVPASLAAESKRFAALRRAIVTQLGEPANSSSPRSAKCIGETRARAIVRHELDVHGYGDWQIEVAGDGFTPERPCAEIHFDGMRRAAILVPVWP
jgi:hypothetical protein